jgi:putative addiction module component (TIGR02574 family)
MNTILAELEQKATELSPEDRSRFALFLIQSLEIADEGDVEEAWRIEAERRLAEIESGEARLVPGDEVFANIRRRLGEQKR